MTMQSVIVTYLTIDYNICFNMFKGMEQSGYGCERTSSGEVPVLWLPKQSA